MTRGTLRGAIAERVIASQLGIIQSSRHHSVKSASFSQVGHCRTPLDVRASLNGIANRPTASQLVVYSGAVEVCAASRVSRQVYRPRARWKRNTDATREPRNVARGRCVVFGQQMRKIGPDKRQEERKKLFSGYRRADVRIASAGRRLRFA